MSRLIENRIVAPPRGMSERMAASRLGLGDPRGAPHHYGGFNPALGFWDEGGVVVPTDGPDDWYRPETGDHFIALGLNTPDYLVLCQEASGDLVPAIDGLTVGNLVASDTGTGGLVYSQAVTGWTADFVGYDGAGTSIFTTSDNGLDVVAGESYAMLCFVSFDVPSGTTAFMRPVGGNSNRVLVRPDNGFLVTRHNVVDTTGTIDHTDLTTVRMIGWYRRGDTNVSGCETNLESIAGTHDESAFGAAKSIGNSQTTTHSARFCWVAIWKGTNAEFDMGAYLAVLGNGSF